VLAARAANNFSKFQRESFLSHREMLSVGGKSGLEKEWSGKIISRSIS